MLTAANCQEQLINNSNFSFIGKDVALANSLMHFHKRHYQPQIFHIESEPIPINVDIAFNNASCIKAWLEYCLKPTEPTGPDADDAIEKQDASHYEHKVLDLAQDTSDSEPILDELLPVEPGSESISGQKRPATQATQRAIHSQQELDTIGKTILEHARYIHNLFILEHVANLLLAGNQDILPILQNYQIRPTYTPAPSLIKLFLLKTERIRIPS